MKKIFIPAAIAAMMGAGAYFGHAAATPADESDLLLANAEALAHDENDEDKDGYKVTCYSSASRDENQAYTDCASCERVEGWMGYGTASFCKVIFE